VCAVLSCTPALPDEPHIKVKKPRGVGECSDRMTIHGYSMLVDLVVERFTEGDGVASVLADRRSLGVIRRKPKVEAVEKMKTRRID
jgi:hypothetical protein